MDCNKEEAKRARNIAEKKMQSRDFGGAKKLLIKALHLSPDIENASHMLTVCDVHCSAGSLVNGQADHYGVLQVELSADEALIRKQYRRLALLLHPDKNKFAGAEAAFKLVGEAYKVLSDRGSRQVYDSRRRVQMRPVPSWQPSQHVRDARRYTGATSNASSNQYGRVKQHDQQPAFFASQTFWTMCIFCSNRFQYSRAWLNIEVQCQSCFHKFHAFEVCPQNIPPPGSSSGIPWNLPGFHHTDIPSQHSYNHGGQTHASNCSKPATAAAKDKKVEPIVDGVAGNRVKSEIAKSVEKPAAKPSSGNARRMRNRRAAVNSSDSDSPLRDSTDGVMEVDSTVLDGESTGCRYPRRSSRHKINVIYKEDESEDDDFVCPSKRSRNVGSHNSKSQDMSPEVVTNGLKMKTSEVPISEDEIKGDQTGINLSGDNLPSQSAHERGTVPESKDAVDKKHAKQVRGSSNAKAAVDSRSRLPQVSYSISYPDPQFYDFDMDRNESKFAVNQIWAVYDQDDGMPRWYALIQKVFAPGFKLQYTWLEYNPTSTAEKAWADAGLPIACGNFRPGKSLSGKSLEIFSHLILFEKVRGNTYNIYPKRGEVWALFKEWDVGWSSVAEPPKKYDYEFVEVISDFAYGKDITVSHLVKVKGFLYLFMRAHDKGATMIPSGQLLKFSHRIPHYNICGERKGIPRDSFELDPAALPQSFVNVSDSFNADTAEVLEADFGDPCLKPQTVEHKLAGGSVKNKGLRPGQNAFETASSKARGGARWNSNDIFDKSGQAREQRHVFSEAPYEQSRRFKSMEHNQRDPCKLNADNNDESDEDPTSNEPEPADSEFYNFQEDRSEEKFKEGQIWALYSEIDGYPNYYALLMKTDWEVNGFVIVKWLEFIPCTEEEDLWAKNGLPIGCGRFKVVPGTDKQDDTHVFSHMVNANLIRKSMYNIHPSSGEVWAVFKNWSLNWTSADIGKNADYSVVEIIERDEHVIKALILAKVKGYKYVFMPEARDAADTEIPINECLRFSHQIPAFRLTNQESGKLKDFWELDPDSIPKILLTTDS